MKRFAGIWCFCMLFGTLMAQEEAAPAPLRVGFGLMGITYQGDLSTEDGDIFRVYPGMNLSLHFEKDKRFRPQLNLGFGKFIDQTDRINLPTADGLTPNPFVETSLLMLDFRLRAWIIKKGRLRPFVGVGAGLLFFTPRDKNGNFLIDNIFSRFEDESYPAFLPVLPLELGFEFRINDKAGIALSYNYRRSGTDYLDNLGRLGPIGGNDAVHTLTATLAVTLRPPKNFFFFLPPVKTDSINVEDIQQVADLIPDQLDTLETYTEEAALLDGMGIGDITWRRTTVRTDADPGVEPYVYQLGDQGKASRQILIEEETTLQQLAKDWEVTMEELSALNPGINETIVVGTLIFLP